ncbi:plastocyanin/azurin family copper-binding protein [Frankia canadensis]|uniref:plastocyanin/azurin family copper-binding protein n=1 Tax=Frankia canadensis TaxID=1836972 RepID=UPI001A9CA762|nr:plastocyanin/azurin family copper-binding protein [Frankia canadensis]
MGTATVPVAALAAGSTSRPAAHGAAANPAHQASWDWPAWNWDGPKEDGHRRNVVVTIPEEDRFTPFGLTIRTGDSVTWKNNDTDDHTVVTDNSFTTTDNRGVNHLIPGTDSNNGRPGVFTLTFRRPGNFVYYCRFHSHLDQFDQPVAPGPDGGIQDANGNFGTPMMGVITVLPKDGGKDDWSIG